MTTLMILEVSWDGLWTPSFGLSQFHGHGSWLMCEVALSVAFGLHKYVFLVMGDGNIIVYVVHKVCESTNGHYCKLLAVWALFCLIIN